MLGYCFCNSCCISNPVSYMLQSISIFYKILKYNNEYILIVIMNHNIILLVILKITMRDTSSITNYIYLIRSLPVCIYVCLVVLKSYMQLQLCKYILVSSLQFSAYYTLTSCIMVLPVKAVHYHIQYNIIFIYLFSQGFSCSNNIKLVLII